MQPAGLALKRSLKKYSQNQGGELMLIHRCTGCGSISINRIAADDDAERIYAVFEESLLLGDQQRAELASNGVLALREEDRNLVRRRLFGEGLTIKMPPTQENLPFLQLMQEEGGHHDS